MLFPTAELYTLSGDSVTVRVTVDTDAASAGIQHVDVVDRDGNTIQASELECARSARFIIPRVLRLRLPIRIIGTECALPDGEPLRPETFGPFLGEHAADGRAQVSCLPSDVRLRNVNNPLCADNQARLQAKQIEIIGLCGQAGRLKHDRDWTQAAMVAAFILAAVLMTLAVLMFLNIFGGQGLGTALLVVGALVLMGALFLLRDYVNLNAAYEAKLAEVANARREYAAIAAETSRVCCDDFVYAPTVAPDC